LVTIVCGAPSSEMSANFNDGEVWVLGNRSHRYPRYTRIFEIHDDLSQHDKDYAQWLVNKKIPLVVGESFPIEAEHVEVFPYSEIEKIIGDTYLTSSSAAMLAYAIYKGVREVDLFGVDLAVDDHEYFFQRPCMEYWVGFARGRGIKVNIPDVSPLCKSDYVEGRDYGKLKPEAPKTKNNYSEIADKHRKKIEEAAERLTNLEKYQQEIEQLKLSITAHDAAAQVYDRMAKVKRAQEAKQKISAITDTVVIQ
jgi:hypothetical protein